MPLLRTMDPTDESDRLHALHSCNILDSAPEPEFDALVKHAARIARVPTALVSLVDEARQWFKARVGMAVSETPRTISFCGHTIRQSTPLVVEDARVDPRFADNPLVTGDPGIVFYAGWPLVTHEGFALGSLCVIDQVPRRLTVAQHEAMALLARQVVLSLELRRAPTQGIEIVSPLSELADDSASRQNADRARSRLAQLVVHDLKNPLTAIASNAAFVLDTAHLTGEQGDAIRDVLDSANRMQAMLLDLLDIGRSGSGDGQLVARPQAINFTQLVRSVVGNGTDHATRTTIRVECERDLKFRADPSLFARVLANLVDNARRHAPSDSTVVISARHQHRGLLVAVADVGDGIADENKRRVFDRYVQLDPGNERTGRGLGLVFCKLAVEAHGGKIYVENNAPRGARFCIFLPTSESIA